MILAEKGYKNLFLVDVSHGLLKIAKEKLGRKGFGCVALGRVDLGKLPYNKNFLILLFVRVMCFLSHLNP